MPRFSAAAAIGDRRMGALKMSCFFRLTARKRAIKSALACRWVESMFSMSVWVSSTFVISRVLCVFAVKERL